MGYSKTVSTATTAGTFTCVGAACSSPKYKITAGSPNTISIDYNNDGVADCVSTRTLINNPENNGAVGELATCGAVTTSFALTSGTTGYLKTNALKAVNWTSFTTAIALDVNVDADCTGGVCDGFYKTEIYDNLAYFNSTVIGAVTDPQTGSAYSLRSFIYAPPGATNTNYDSAVKSSGFVTSTKAGVISADLSNFDFQGIVYIPAATWIKSTSTLTKNFIKSICDQAAEHGLIVVLQATDAADVPVRGDNSWTDVVAVLKSYSDIGAISVMSAQKILDTVSTVGSGWTVTAGVATRTYGATAVDANTLTGSSPALQAGVYIPAVHAGTDLAGNPIFWLGGVDLGAYGTVHPTELQ